MSFSDVPVVRLMCTVYWHDRDKQPFYVKWWHKCVLMIPTIPLIKMKMFILYHVSITKTLTIRHTNGKDNLKKNYYNRPL